MILCNSKYRGSRTCKNKWKLISHIIVKKWIIIIMKEKLTVELIYLICLRIQCTSHLARLIRLKFDALPEKTDNPQATWIDSSSWPNRLFTSDMDKAAAGTNRLAYADPLGLPVHRTWPVTYMCYTRSSRATLK